MLVINETLNLPLADKQAFLDEIKGGKAFIGMHSASDTFHGEGNKVDPYIEMLGGEFLTHDAQVGISAINQDPTHPATRNPFLGATPRKILSGVFIPRSPPPCTFCDRG